MIYDIYIYIYKAYHLLGHYILMDRRLYAVIPHDRRDRTQRRKSAVDGTHSPIRKKRLAKGGERPFKDPKRKRYFQR